ncbi:hypothetical protein D8I35_17795 [Corticibacter populi]|uniref:Uncharacterized protein n=1 Tax=Corticibacter populi TaxID=1550736 RepID=A0A3M6QJ78_9BURK|nr:hypothetical protein [Corticibacter populi]RMX03025.1 hypothetical protein D8I35_17795 [Corticibacter populi]
MKKKGQSKMSFGSTPSAFDESVRARLLYIRQWPDFSLQYDISRIGDIARICALLSRKPTVGFLVHRAVDLPSYEVETMLQELFDAGCIGIFQAAPTPSAAAPDGAAPALPKQPAAPSERAAPAPTVTAADAMRPPSSPEGSFLHRLWKKLVA